MGEPVEIKVSSLSHEELGKIACWLADGTLGANLRFYIKQEESDFDVARNITIGIENPTLLTVDSLKSLILASFQAQAVFRDH